MIKIEYGDRAQMSKEYISIFQDINSILSNDSNNIFSKFKYNLEEILTADFEKLCEINIEYNRQKNLLIDTYKTEAKNLAPSDSAYIDSIDKETEFSKIDNIIINKAKEKLSKKKVTEEVRKEIEPYFKYSITQIFNYDKYYDNIAKFLKDRLQLNTCYYCNMSYINYFNTLEKDDEGNDIEKRQFDLDHFIPKSKYPITALSLFNFVPSCKVCNSTAKGTNEILEIEDISDGKITIEDAIKLSPTSEQYNFDKKVKIYPLPKKENENWSTFFERDGEGFEIHFHTEDPVYANEFKTLRLPERYDFHKIEALRLLELQERYTDEKIRDMIKDLRLNLSVEEIKEDILQTNFKTKYNRTFAKMYKDIITYYINTLVSTKKIADT